MVKDRAIVFQLEKLLTTNNLRTAGHSETLLQEAWAQMNPSERHQVVMLRKMRAEVKIGDSQWW